MTVFYIYICSISTEYQKYIVSHKTTSSTVKQKASILEEFYCLLSLTSKRGRDIAIFRFIETAAAAILDFQNFEFLTVRRLKRTSFVVIPYLVKIGLTAAEIGLFFIFQERGRHHLGLLNF